MILTREQLKKRFEELVEKYNQREKIITEMTEIEIKGRSIREKYNELCKQINKERAEIEEDFENGFDCECPFCKEFLKVTYRDNGPSAPYGYRIWCPCCQMSTPMEVSIGEALDWLDEYAKLVNGEDK